MFFLGFKNALFVGFAIPMSMFMSLMILEGLRLHHEHHDFIRVNYGAWDAG